MKFFLFLCLFLLLGFGCGSLVMKNFSVEPTPLTIPGAIEENCVGFLIGGPEETELIHEIGGAWARPHPGPFIWQEIEPSQGEFDFSAADEFVQQGQANEVALLGTIWPFADWDQAACHDAKCKVSPDDTFYNDLPVSRCAPCSMDDYEIFISALVERYDGDGVDDMPDLTLPIKYWEILNEPEMDSPELTFYKGTSEGYLGLVKTSQEAVAATCSDCQIVQAGAAGIESDMLAYWQNLYAAGLGQYLDVANIHYIKNGDSSTLNVKDFKSILTKQKITKPIWVTEAEYSSEKQITASFTGALQAGADKVFFTQFKVGEYGLPSKGKYSAPYAGLADKCDGKL
jgi:hypothetical protein